MPMTEQILTERAGARAAMTAEMSTMREAAESAEASAAEEVAQAAAEEPAAEGEPAEEPAAEEGEEGEGPAAEEGEEPAAPAEKADPATQKRLATVQAAEKRAKEAIARERAELDRQRAELAEGLRAVEQFRALAKRAKYDPAGTLRALGLNDEDMDVAARHVYASGKTAAADPKSREAADRALREREYQDEVSSLRARVDEQDRRWQEAEAQRHAAEYVDGVVKVTGSDTPLVASMVVKAPARARAELLATAERLWREYGEVPDPADVARALEAERRAELELLGLDSKQIPGQPVGSKTKSPAAGEKRAALSNDLGKPTQPRTAPKTREETKADVRRAMAEGRIE